MADTQPCEHCTLDAERTTAHPQLDAAYRLLQAGGMTLGTYAEVVQREAQRTATGGEQDGRATKQRWCACCDAWIDVPTDVDHAFEGDDLDAVVAREISGLGDSVTRRPCDRCGKETVWDLCETCETFVGGEG